MKITENLNIVIPLYTDDTYSTIYAYVHSMPISREVFEANFLLISKTFTQIHAQGLGEIGGPRIAMLMMKAVAEKAKLQEDEAALMNEIRRLTNVLTKTPQGWVSAPYQDTLDQHKLDADDVSEVENSLVYFTVVSSMHKRRDRKEMLSGAVKLWGAQISSLDSTPFLNSLTISTPAAPPKSTTNPPAGSSVPY